MSVWVFVAVAWVLGPFFAISYGLEQLGQDTTLLYSFFVYALPMPFLYMLLDWMERRGMYELGVVWKLYRYGQEKAVEMGSGVERITKRFTDRMGYLGYHVFLALFTFVFGIIFAFLLIYSLKPKKSAIFSILGGCFVGIVFWWTVLVYEVVDPANVFFVITVFTVLSFVYGKSREKQILLKASREVYHGFRKRASKIGRGVRLGSKKAPRSTGKTVEAE